MEQLSKLIRENNINEFIDLYETIDINMIPHINSLLVVASIYGRFNIIKYLIQQGATNLNRALQMSMNHYYYEHVKYLIEHGASNLNFALRRSIRYDEFDLAKYIIQRGKGYDIDLAILFANKYDNKEILECLIQQKK